MDDDLLTTNDAADLLNVLHELPLGLVRSGRLIAKRRDGRDWVARPDVVSYRRERDEDRRRRLDELVERSEDAGGYSEIA